MKIRIEREEPFTSRHAGLLAVSAAAAATAAWVEFKSRRAERDNPPKGKFVYVDGTRLHYIVRGEGPPVVLLHGNAVMLSDFEASGLIDQLARNHQVIAFDRPGFGHSTRPRNRLWTPTAQAAVLRRALVQLGIQRAAVVGHSLGTQVALAMALDSPGSVSGLVLIGGYYYPTMRVDAMLTAPVAVPVLGDVMRYTVTALTARAMLDRMVRTMFAPNEVPPGFLPAVSREMMLRPLQLRADAEDAAFMMPQARSLSKRYGELKMPVTVLAGQDDRILDPKAHSQRLHEALAQSELHVVPGIGHMLHHIAHDLIVAAVDKSDRGLDSAAHRGGASGEGASQTSEASTAIPNPAFP